MNIEQMKEAFEKLLAETRTGIVKVEDHDRSVPRVRLFAFLRRSLLHGVEGTHLVSAGHRLGFGCARRMKIERGRARRASRRFLLPRRLTRRAPRRR